MDIWQAQDHQTICDVEFPRLANQRSPYIIICRASRPMGIRVGGPIATAGRNISKLFFLSLFFFFFLLLSLSVPSQFIGQLVHGECGWEKHTRCSEDYPHKVRAHLNEGPAPRAQSTFFFLHLFCLLLSASHVPRMSG